MYTYKVEQAIKAACVLHQDQLRKGAVPLPYISHLMAVVLILRDYTEDEDTLVAALLHDTLEDSDYTAEEMTEDFGATVTELVLPLTEPKYDGEYKLTWREKKQSYLKQLKNSRSETLMIVAADKIHNFRSMVEEYHEDYERFRRDFWEQGEERLEFYQSLSNILNSRLKSAIIHEFNHTFNEFKEFYINAKKST